MNTEMGCHSLSNMLNNLCLVPTCQHAIILIILPTLLCYFEKVIKLSMPLLVFCQRGTYFIHSKY